MGRHEGCRMCAKRGHRGFVSVLELLIPIFKHRDPSHYIDRVQ